jgi:histidinol-phosphatase (PHP family)
MYRQLGGEIVTLGSDAHRVEDVGKGIEGAAQYLKELGFQYYTVYHRRKPEFIPL